MNEEKDEIKETEEELEDEELEEDEYSGLSEREKELLQKIEESEDSEEIMKLIEELNSINKNFKVEARPVTKLTKLFYYLFNVLEGLLLGIVLFGLVCIFKPFRIINETGLYIFLGSVVVFQIILPLIIRLIEHPLMMIFSRLIVSVLMLAIIIIMGLVLSDFMFIDGSDLFALSIFTVIIKHLIMSTIRKLIRG